MVRSSYDPRTDALYLTLRPGKVARTEKVDDRTHVSLGVDGRAIGVKVIHPSCVWPVQEVIRRYHICDGTRRILEVLFPGQPGEGAPAAGSVGDVQSNK